MFNKPLAPEIVKSSLVNAKLLHLNGERGYCVKDENNNKIGYILYTDKKSTLIFSFKDSILFDDEVGKLTVRSHGRDRYRVEKYQVRFKYRKCGIAYLLLKLMINMLKQQSGTAIYTYPQSANDYGDPRLAPYDLYNAYHRQGFKFQDTELEKLFVDENSEKDVFNTPEHVMILSLV